MSKQPDSQTTKSSDQHMTNAGLHLYHSNDGKIHHCCSSEVHPGIKLVWTDCGKDVPANISFRSWEAVTCMECAIAMDQENLESMGAFDAK